MVRLALNDRVSQLRTDGCVGEALCWPRFRTDRQLQREVSRSLCNLTCFMSGVGACFGIMRWPAAVTLIAVPLSVWSFRLWFARCDGEPLIEYPSGLEQPCIWAWLTSAAISIACSLNSDLVGPGVVCGWLIAFGILLTHLHKHYLWYLSAHHNLAIETQNRWRNQLVAVWVSFRPFPPALGYESLEQKEKDLYRRAMKVFSFQRRKLVCVVTWFATGLGVGYGFGAWGFMVFTLVSLFAVIAVKPRRFASTVEHATLCFLYSPLEVSEDDRAPWSARSPVGNAKSRRELVAVVWGVLSASLSSLLVSVLLQLQVYRVDVGRGAKSHHVFDGAFEWGKQVSEGNVSLVVIPIVAALICAAIAHVTVPLMLVAFAGNTWFCTYRLLDNGE